MNVPASTPVADPPGISVADVHIGSENPLVVIAGPCSVESLDQFRATANSVKAAGASLLRGGAFKPRTSPYSFQGLGLEGLEIMRAVADEVGMGLVTEVMAPGDVAMVAQFADMIQIGARNMNNVHLLHRAGTSGLPILLKRGMTATIGDTIVAAESILALENDQVVICERGGRTFEPALRNSLDIGAVPELQFRSDLPVIVDPSHGTGRSDLVEPIALASVAAGADGLMVEVHPEPAAALSDGFQAIKASQFPDFMRAVRDMALAIGRRLWNG